MAGNDIEVQFGANTSEAVAGIIALRNELQGLSSPVRSLVENVGKLADVFATVFAADKLKNFIEDMGELGVQTERTMAMLGLTSEQVGEMSGMAALTGSSMEGLTNSIERMSLNIQRSTRDAFNPAAQGLKLLGLNAKDFIALPTDERFLALATAVGQFNPSLNLTNALMAVGGRGVAQMLPLLLRGAEGFKEMQSAIQDAGSALKGPIAAALADMHEKLTELSLSATGFKNISFAPFISSISGVGQALTIMFQAMKDSINEGGAFGKMLDFLTYTAKGLASVIVVVIGLIVGLGEAATAIFKLAAGDIDKFQDYAKSAVTDFETLARKMKDAITSIWAPNVTINAAGGKKDAGPMDMSGKANSDAASVAIDTEIKKLQGALELKKEIYKADADTFKITENQKSVLTEQALSEEYEGEKNLLQQKLALHAGEPKAREEVLKQIAALENKYQKDILKTYQDSVKAQMQVIQGYLQDVTSAFDSQLRGLLAGTTSWAQAMKNISADLTIRFIEEGEKWVTKRLASMLADALTQKTVEAGEVASHAAAEAAKTTATLAGVTARSGLGATAAVADTAVEKTAAVASIETSIGKLFAGVAAFLAPLQGPAAPAEAAGVAAATNAAAMGMIAYEQGGWEVPGGPAFLHPGEMVIPKPFAQSLRENGGSLGGGGDTNNLYISAVDARSVANLIQGNSDIIGKVVEKYVRKNPSRARALS